MLDKGPVDRLALRREHPPRNRKPLGGQKIGAAGGDGVGVCHADHHPRNPGGKDGPGAGRGAPGMVARLQGHIDGGVFRLVAGIEQGVDLGVWLAGLAMVALADHPSRLHHHRAHGRIRRGSTHALFGLAQGQAHEIEIGGQLPFP